MPLQLDYRPQSLEEFFGNKNLIQSLKNYLERDNKPHTLLFCGPSGCGKTTLARIIAKEMKCSGNDLHEYNISDMRGIDTARDIIMNSKFEPLYGDTKVMILNECHKATKEFQNAMLEILEEPPESVYFFLCTTEPEAMIRTILTRSMVLKVQPLVNPEMSSLINWVLESEQKKISNEVLLSTLHAAEGCPRKALVILDQIVDLKSEKDQLEAIDTVYVKETEAIELCRLIASNTSSARRWKEMVILLKGVDKDKAETTRRIILGYLTAVLLGQE